MAMQITTEQHGPDIHIRFHAHETTSTTPAEKKSMDNIAEAIAKYIADIEGSGQAVKRDEWSACLTCGQAEILHGKDGKCPPAF